MNIVGAIACCCPPARSARSLGRCDVVLVREALAVLKRDKVRQNQLFPKMDWSAVALLTESEIQVKDILKWASCNKFEVLLINTLENTSSSSFKTRMTGFTADLSAAVEGDWQAWCYGPLADEVKRVFSAPGTPAPYSLRMLCLRTQPFAGAAHAGAAVANTPRVTDVVGH